MTLPELSREEITRYSRHLLLPQLGMRGQQKIKAASVLVVGLGGLGSPVSMYLAAAGVGKLGLVDYDRVDVSNLQRQVVHSTRQQGELKADSAAKRLAEINPEIEIHSLPVEFNAANAYEVSSGYDILVDGTDNIPTRYLLNDLAVLTGRPYFYGSIFRFEGQVSIFGTPGGPCYRCLFPEPPPPGSIPSCSAAGVMGILPGTIGTIQATEVLKWIAGIGNPLAGELLLYDALDMSVDRVRIRKRPACPLCGENPSIHGLDDYEAWCRSKVREAAGTTPGKFDLEPGVLQEMLKSTNPPQLVDIRDEFELTLSELPGAIHIPLADLENRLAELDRDRMVVVFCRNGVRSLRALEVLQQQGFENCMHLRGGINAWAEQLDDTMNIY